MYIKLLRWLKVKLLNYAKKRPYVHIDDYMQRWWIVPYKHEFAIRFVDNPFSWVLQLFDISIRVHEILRSDSERVYHDHPWDYITILLEGGYYEVCPVEAGKRYVCTKLGKSYTRKYYPVGSILRRAASHKHRLVLPSKYPVTTLFITFRKKQSWGFYPEDGIFVPYKEYLKDHAR